MLEEVKNFFEKVYIETAHAIERKYSWSTPREFVDRGIDDCFVVSMFAQTTGAVKFEEVDPLYNEYKEKLESLLTK